LASRWLSRSSVALLLACGTLVSVPGGGAPLAAQTSTERNPTFVFSSPGAKQVTLEVCNEAGCNQVTKTVTVLDPTPVVDAAVVGPVVVEAGRLVRLAGLGHGQPPLGYTWRAAQGISIATGTPVLQASGPLVWWDTNGLAPGVYAVQLDLSNGVGTVASSLPTLVTVLPQVGASFYTVPPCRLLDTRSASVVGALTAGAVRMVQVTGRCGIPAGAEAISVNVTAVGPTAAGHVTVYPGNYPRPVASTLNFGAFQTRANDAILALASDGTGTLAAEGVVVSGGTVHLLIDVNGYFL
jgi:PKD repeat protein